MKLYSSPFSHKQTGKTFPILCLQYFIDNPVNITNVGFIDLLNPGLIFPYHPCHSILKLMFVHGLLLIKIRIGSSDLWLTF